MSTTPFNEAQQAIAERYDNGDFSYVTNMNEVNDTGDIFFKAIMTEASDKEDCFDLDEALKRVASVICQFQNLETALLNKALPDEMQLLQSTEPGL